MFLFEKEAVGYATVAKKRAEKKPERVYRCAACGAAITTPAEAIAVGGDHAHTFVNPGGYIFRVGCFRDAPGCALSGDPTSEFTWFAGYTWNFALCGACRAHLGWGWSGGESGDDLFYGLILDRLTLGSSEK